MAMLNLILSDCAVPIRKRSESSFSRKATVEGSDLSHSTKLLKMLPGGLHLLSIPNRILLPTPARPLVDGLGREDLSQVGLPPSSGFGSTKKPVTPDEWVDAMLVQSISSLHQLGKILALGNITFDQEVAPLTVVLEESPSEGSGQDIHSDGVCCSFRVGERGDGFPRERVQSGDGEGRIQRLESLP